MLLTLKRILKFGWQGFYRNKALSAQVVFILFVAVFSATFLFLFYQVSNYLISETQAKVDISVYFKQGSKEVDILEIKNQLENMEDKIQKVDYISQEEAQQIFIAKHQDDPLYLDALNEVEGNPFFAALNISATSPEYYDYIANLFAQEPLSAVAEKISYNRNKDVIARLFEVISNIKMSGLILTIFFTLLSALITFNTIKLSIFSMKREISTRKLVGADNWFIRGPFLTQAAIYGVVALVIFDGLFVGLAIFLNSQLKPLLLDFDVLHSLVFANGLLLLLIQSVFVFVVALGSSWLAIRKYLKV